MQNTSEMFSLSEKDMLALWREQMHLDPVRRDLAISRDDGIDMTAWLTTRLRLWYANLLATAPLDWLPIDDVSGQVLLGVNVDGHVSALLPAQCVRPVEWQLEGWKHSVTEFLQPTHWRARLQCDPWLRGGKENPVAVDMGNRLVLYGLDEDEVPALTTARCVVRPTDGTYRMHYLALSTLPTTLIEA